MIKNIGRIENLVLEIELDQRLMKKMSRSPIFGKRTEVMVWQNSALKICLCSIDDQIIAIDIRNVAV